MVETYSLILKISHFVHYIYVQTLHVIILKLSEFAFYIVIQDSGGSRI